MRKKTYAAFLCAVILAATCTLPLQSARAETTGTVFGGWLILRDSPSFSGAIRSSYPAGTVVTITGQQGSWYAVKAPDGLTGYMLGDYLKINNSGNGNSGGYGGGSATGKTAYVASSNGLNVRLRSGPGKGYSILASYAPGTECTILSSGTNWSRVQIGSLTGYMMTCYLSGNPAATPVPQSQLSEGYEVYVISPNGQGVNLRSGPDKSYGVIGFYSVGSPAWMVSPGNIWSYIRVGNRYGYMMSQFLTTKMPEMQEEYATGGAYIVSANGRNVNLRSAPTTASTILRSFPVGTKLSIITRGTDWYFVQIEGYYGYMMRQFIYDTGVYETPSDSPLVAPDGDGDEDDEEDDEDEYDDDEDDEDEEDDEEYEEVGIIMLR